MSIIIQGYTLRYNRYPCLHRRRHQAAYMPQLMPHQSGEVLLKKKWKKIPISSTCVWGLSHRLSGERERSPKPMIQGSGPNLGNPLLYLITIHHLLFGCLTYSYVDPTLRHKFQPHLQNNGEQPSQVHFIDQNIRDIAQEFRFTVNEVQEYYDKCGEMSRTRRRFEKMRQKLTQLEDEDD